MSSSPESYPPSAHLPLQVDGFSHEFSRTESPNLNQVVEEPVNRPTTSIHPTLQRLQALIVEDFSADKGSELALEIKSIHDTGISVVEDPNRNQIVDLKFMYSHWYACRVADSIACLRSTSSTQSERRLAIKTLNVLKPFISAQELSDSTLDTLQVGTESNELLHRVVSDGRLPDSMQKFRAYEPHRKFSGLPESWPEEAKNIAYRRTADGSVEYRGIRFRSGDFMVADLAVPHDGLLESFLKDLPVYTHGGLFVDYEPRDGGQRIPAVIEIHKKGKRIVPLAAWLSPNFVYLARALRLDKVQEDISQPLSFAYRNMPEISYDWQARDPLPEGQLIEGRRCATCTTLGAILMAQIGINFPMPRAPLTAKSIENLIKLRLTNLRDFYSTSNLGLASGLRSVGTIDNRSISANFARYMYIGYSSIQASFGDNMANRTLVPSRLPFSYRTAAFEITLAQRKDLLGKTVQHVAGFKTSQMPDSGSPEVIAFYLISNHVLDDGIKQFMQCESVREHVSMRRPLIMSELIQSQAIVRDRQRIQDAIGATRWYD